MKVRDVLYILTYEGNYKVIIVCDTILQKYYITDRRKCEHTKRYTIVNSIKYAHKLLKEKLGRRAGGLEGKGSEWYADDPRFRYASLISNRKNPQASRFKI